MSRIGSPLPTSQIIKPTHVWAMAVALAVVLLGPLLLLPSPYNLLPFVVLGGSLFVYTSFRQPYVGLFVYLFIFFFRPYEMFPVPVPYEKIVAIVVLVILAVHLIVRRIEIRFNRLDWAVTGVVIAAALSVPSFTDMGDSSKSFFAFFEFFKIFLVYFFTLQIANTKSKLEAILWLFVLSNVYLAVTTTYNYYTGHYRVSMGIARARGIADDGLFAHPNSVANNAVLGMPFVFYFFHHYRSLAVKLSLLAIMALSAWTVVITGSRGGMMALFAFVLITGWRSKYRGLSLAASLIAIIGVVAIMPGQYQERLLSLTNIFGTDTTGAAESAHGRIDGIVSGLKLFSLRPLTGVGIGSFGRSRYLVEGVGTEAHSLIGQVFGELGIFGVAAFIWFLLTKHRHMKNLLAEYGPRNWSPDLMSAATKATQTALLLLLVQGLSGHNMFRYNWYIFACFISIMTILTKARADAETAAELPVEPAPDAPAAHAGGQST